jgi:mannose-6-phosphate isomerase-like protein (cupin superfamily)
MKPVNLVKAFESFAEQWSPRVAADLTGQQVKLVKLQGEFVWHFHAHEDELFLVHRGVLRMQIRGTRGDARTEREVVLRPGEMLVIPHGVEHRPCADEQVEVLLFEPASTLSTGNVRGERRGAAPARL